MPGSPDIVPSAFDNTLNQTDMLPSIGFGASDKGTEPSVTSTLACGTLCGLVTSNVVLLPGYSTDDPIMVPAIITPP
ncbi:hypothetical protein D3C73_1284250 [compost metagenome]